MQIVEPEKTYGNIGPKAAYLIGQLGDKAAVEPLLKIYESQALPEIRANAASALGGLKDIRAFDSLLSGLNDSNEDIRVSSAFALSNLKDKRAVEPLIQLLNRSSNSEASDVADALANLGDSRAFEPIMEFFNRCSDEDYPSIVESLGLLDDPRVFDTLIEFSKVRDGKIQIAAVRGLMFLGDPRAIPRLEWIAANLKFTDDLVISIKKHALDAIGSINYKHYKLSIKDKHV